MQRELFVEPAPVEIEDMSDQELFLDRIIPRGYHDYWLKMIQELPNVVEPNVVSLFIFAIRKHWFAIPSSLMKEVMAPKTIYPIPHKSRDILLGFVKVKGELELMIALNRLLFKDEADRKDLVPSRFVMMCSGQDSIIFGVENVGGMHACDQRMLDQISKDEESLIQGSMLYQDKRVNILNHEALFETLRTVLRE